MTDPTEIEILPPVDETEPEDREDFIADDPAPKRGPGWSALGVAVLLSGVLGAVGGGVIAQYLDSDPVSLSPLESKIEQLGTTQAKLRTDLDAAARKASARPTVDLSSIEARLDALEARPAPDPDAIAKLDAAQADGFEWPDVSDLEVRLEALETRPAPEPIIIEQSASDRTKPEPESYGDTTSIKSDMPFPKAALLSAADARAESGGFLSKHIRVRRENDPKVMIDRVEALLSDGELDAALRLFDRLPAQIRSAGQDWRRAQKSG